MHCRGIVSLVSEFMHWSPIVPHSTKKRKEKKILIHGGVDLIMGIMAIKYWRFWSDKVVKRKDVKAKTPKKREWKL